MAKQTTNLVSIDQLVFADNVRTPQCTDIPDMVARYQRAGRFSPDHPISVLKSEDGYLVLRGNRRSLAAIHIRENDPDLFGQLFPNGKIPACVYEGLTPEEVVLLRIDHGADDDRMPLDEWSLYLAIRQLVLIGGFSQDRIAEHLQIRHTKGKNKGKPNRSLVQQRVNLAKLPSFVQNEMKVACEGGDTPMGWSKVATLYKTFMEEFSDHPSGDGPKFTEAWQKAMTPKEKGKTTPAVGKVLSAKDAKERALACSSKILREVLLSVTGQGGRDLATIDAELLAMETATVEA